MSPAQHSAVIQHLASHVALEGGHGGHLVRRHRVGLGVACQELVVVLHSHPDLVGVGGFTLVAQLGQVEVIDRPRVPEDKKRSPGDRVTWPNLKLVR